MASTPEKEPAPNGKKLLRAGLWTLAVLTLLNLLFSASIAALIGGIVIWVMVWGIKKGDYPLVRRLSVFLLFYAAVNLTVLLLTLVSGAAARTSALIWLGLYSAALAVLSALLRSRPVRDYLKTAKPPAEKEKKIRFFRGGWRDL